MLKRVDLFMPPISQYSVLHHFTRKLAEGFNRVGVNARILEAEKNNPKPFLDAIFSDPPDCTISFNGLLPDENGNFLADMIKIPHVALVVDSPNQYFPLATSKYTIVASVDRFYCDFFRGLGCPHVLFIPHAVEAELATSPKTERVFDVVMLGSFLDPEKIRQDWLKVCTPPELCKIMDEAAEISLMQDETSYIKAFVEAIARQEGKFGGLDPSTINYPLVFDQLEAFIRAKERIELIKSIKDAKVNLFGSGAVPITQKYLRNSNANVIAHDGVPFEQALEIFKKTKITLNSAPHLKDGSHERVFSALAAGSSVISSESSYLREIFKSKDGLIFYSFKDRNKVNDEVNRLLHNEAERQKSVQSKQKTVLDGHTWDHRAMLLARELSPILQGVS